MIRHYKSVDGIVGYAEGDVLVCDDTGERSLVVRDGSGIKLTPVIDRCSVCNEPAHASETDDLDRCAKCRPVEEDVFHCAWCANATKHADGYAPDEAEGDLICETCNATIGGAS